VYKAAVPANTRDAFPTKKDAVPGARNPTVAGHGDLDNGGGLGKIKTEPDHVRPYMAHPPD